MNAHLLLAITLLASLIIQPRGNYSHFNDYKPFFPLSFARKPRVKLWSQKTFELEISACDATSFCMIITIDMRLAQWNCVVIEAEKNTRRRQNFYSFVLATNVTISVYVLFWMTIKFLPENEQFCLSVIEQKKVIELNECVLKTQISQKRVCRKVITTFTTFC